MTKKLCLKAHGRLIKDYDFSRILAFMGNNQDYKIASYEEEADVLSNSPVRQQITKS